MPSGWLCVCVCVCLFGVSFSKISSWWQRSCWLIQDLLFNLSSSFFFSFYSLFSLISSLLLPPFLLCSSFLFPVFISPPFFSFPSLIHPFLTCLHASSLSISPLLFLFFARGHRRLFSFFLFCPSLHPCLSLSCSLRPPTPSGLKHLSALSSGHTSTHWSAGCFPESFPASWLVESGEPQVSESSPSTSSWFLISPRSECVCVCLCVFVCVCVCVFN